MGDETPETEEADVEADEEHPPAHILIHGARTPTPQEINEHPDIDASPTEVFLAVTAGAFILAAAWEGFETVVKAASY